MQYIRPMALAVIFLGWCAPLAADPAAQLQTVLDEYWAFVIEENPVFASRSGHREYDNRLGTATPADLLRRAKREQQFLNRLGDLSGDELTTEQLINRDLLSWVLTMSIESYEQDTARIPFNSFSGFFTSAINSHRGLSMRDAADYRAYIQRIRDFPRYFAEHMSNMRRGIDDGFVLPKVTIDGIAPTVAAMANVAPGASALFQPFTNMPESIDPDERAQLRAAGEEAIRAAALPALQAFHQFLTSDYYGAATDSFGIGELPNGADYYAHQIRNYVTVTDLDADMIHARGLAEVARIKAEMLDIIERLEFEGSFEEFTEFLRTDPQFYAKTSTELLAAAAYASKRADHVMPGFFGVLPRLSYGVVAVPDAIAPNYTTASYNPAAIGGTKGGEYWVNTYALDQRPLYELMALTLHEAVPGHHHQIALAQELDSVPEFRKQLYFSAFGEGWALYAEKLGVEMGVYQDDYEQFGRLSYEMWRACRLVIDTGIHAKGWSRQSAIDYLGANTSLSAQNVRAEVDRYISWPGQALAYKIGEIKVWELRARAEAALGVGERFDIREFHDVLLGNGALPLTMLEAEVDRYIETKLSE